MSLIPSIIVTAGRLCITLSRHDRPLNNLLEKGFSSIEAVHEAINLKKNDAAALLIACGHWDLQILERIIREDLDDLFLAFLCSEQYPVTELKKEMIEHNALKIISSFLEKGGLFNHEDFLNASV